MRYVFGSLVVAVALAIGLSGDRAAGGKDEPKFTIKEVMQKAHTPGAKSLLKKVSSGKADEAEKKELVALYTALAQNKPPKGDEKDWKERTGKMLDAAKAAAKGDEKAAASLAEIVNCMGCHSEHKGKKKAGG